MTTSETTLRIDDEECRRLGGVLEVVGRRWASAILLAVGRGAHRFSQIQAGVDGLSARMLTVRLRELEDAGLVQRVVAPTTPVSVRYGLTEQGRDLLSALQPIGRYALRWES